MARKSDLETKNSQTKKGEQAGKVLGSITRSVKPSGQTIVIKSHRKGLRLDVVMATREPEDMHILVSTDAITKEQRPIEIRPYKLSKMQIQALEAYLKRDWKKTREAEEYIITADFEFQDGVLGLPKTLIEIIAPEIIKKSMKLYFSDLLWIAREQAPTAKKLVEDALFEWGKKLDKRPQIDIEIPEENEHNPYTEERALVPSSGLQERVDALEGIFSDAGKQDVAELEGLLEQLKAFQDNPPSQGNRRTAAERAALKRRSKGEVKDTRLVQAGLNIEPELRDIISTVAKWYGSAEKSKMMREAILSNLIFIVESALEVARENTGIEDKKAKKRSKSGLGAHLN